jgi:hypothetical protein
MRTNADNCCGFVGDVFIVEGESSGTDNFFAAMVNFVLGGLREDGREGMDSLQLVIRDDHEEGGRVSLIASRSLSVGFPLSGGGGVVRLFEETVVFVGVHFLVGNCCRELLTNKGSIFLGKKSWVGAVKGCNDDDQSNSVGKGKLRVLGAFGDSSESVGSYIATVVLVALLVSSSNLISIATSSRLGRNQRGITRYEEEQYWW